MNSLVNNPIELSKNRKYLKHHDGTSFFWLADTWWYGMTSRMKWEDFKKLVADRKRKGFTVVQIVVGIPPEIDEFSLHAANSGGLPFEKDGGINHQYFPEVDKKISYLVKNGIVPCIVGSWGHHIDRLGMRAMKNLWKEIVNRYAHYPVVFCLTGEVGIFPFIRSRIRRLLKQVWMFLFPKSTRDLNLNKRLKQWSEVAKYIKKIDPHNRPLTVHINSYMTASKLFNDPLWLDIDSIQSGHTKQNAAFMVSSILNAQNEMCPIINLEPWYEGILNNFNDYWQRYAFWACILSGAKGHTYGAHGIWQMSVGSDFMKHWGESDWKTAMNYPGSKQLGIAKKFLEKYEWCKLKPNFDLIQPHWQKNKTNSPLAAEIDNRYIFAYFPDLNKRHSFYLNLNKKVKCTLTWLNPTTMKVICKQEYSQQRRLTIPPNYPAKDIFLLASYQPIID